jgi:hypothetical protein
LTFSDIELNEDGREMGDEHEKCSFPHSAKVMMLAAKLKHFSRGRDRGTVGTTVMITR